MPRISPTHVLGTWPAPSVTIYLHPCAQSSHLYPEPSCKYEKRWRQPSTVFFLAISRIFMPQWTFWSHKSARVGVSIFLLKQSSSVVACSLYMLRRKSWLSWCCHAVCMAGLALNEWLKMVLWNSSKPHWGFSVEVPRVVLHKVLPSSCFPRYNHSPMWVISSSSVCWWIGKGSSTQAGMAEADK